MKYLVICFDQNDNPFMHYGPIDTQELCEQYIEELKEDVYQPHVTYKWTTILEPGGSFAKRRAAPGQSEPVAWEAKAKPHTHMGVMVKSAGLKDMLISDANSLYGKGEYDLRPLVYGDVTEPPPQRAIGEEGSER